MGTHRVHDSLRGPPARRPTFCCYENCGHGMGDARSRREKSMTTEIFTEIGIVFVTALLTYGATRFSDWVNDAPRELRECRDSGLRYLERLVEEADAILVLDDARLVSYLASGINPFGQAAMMEFAVLDRTVDRLTSFGPFTDNREYEIGLIQQLHGALCSSRKGYLRLVGRRYTGSYSYLDWSGPLQGESPTYNLDDFRGDVVYIVNRAETLHRYMRQIVLRSARGVLRRQIKISLVSENSTGL